MSLKVDIHRKLHGQSGDFELHMDFEVKAGEIVALFGPSGAGKTSTLRMIAGLMEPDSGRISAFGETWYSSKEGINKRVRHRNLGFVFQDYALFPNMTVIQQLEFAQSRDSDPLIIKELLNQTGLYELRDKKPGSMSGGQQQRLALARALVRKPSLLLLDEPLAALDHMNSTAMQELLKRIHAEYHPAIVMVSHNPKEIEGLSDKVINLSVTKPIVS